MQLIEKSYCLDIDYSYISHICTVGQLNDVAELCDFHPESDSVFQFTGCFPLELHKMPPFSKSYEEKLRKSRCQVPLFA